MATLAANLRRADTPLAQSIRVWVALLGFLAGVQLFITYVGAGLERDPRASLFSWPAIALFCGPGLGAVLHRRRDPVRGLLSPAPDPAAAVAHLAPHPPRPR